MPRDKKAFHCSSYLLCDDQTDPLVQDMSPVEPEVGVDDDHVARVEVPLHPARAHARTLGGRLQEPGLRATDLGLQIFFSVVQIFF